VLRRASFGRITPPDMIPFLIRKVNSFFLTFLGFCEKFLNFWKFCFFIFEKLIFFK